jgi:hypothetical protein
MSKKKTNEQPDYLAELLKNGNVTITAKTREELTEIVSGLSAECRYGGGAVGKNKDSGLFTLRLHLINE